MTRSLKKESKGCDNALQGNSNQEVFNIFKKLPKAVLQQEHLVRRSKRKVHPEAENSNKRMQMENDDIHVVEEKLKDNAIENLSQLPVHLKKSTNRRLYAPNVSEIDHAPFSDLNVTCPIIISSANFPENWSLPSYIQYQMTPYFSPFHHTLTKFPQENDEDVLDKHQFTRIVGSRKKLIARFSNEEISWFSWAEKCRESVTTMSWCDALRPTTTNLWIGNTESAAAARQFVSRWKRRVIREDNALADNKPSIKRTDSDSDYEYDDDDETLLNPLIICGPSGSGKTSLVSSICDELGMKILEVHPGEKRNGSSLKAKLAGAIQSHRVQCSGGLASFFAPKSAVEHKTVEKQQTLIVVEHVDIYFHDDKEYFSTLKNLAAESKVPMIWTCDRLPVQEMYREPALPFEHLEISRTPDARLAKYARMCVLALTGLDIPQESLTQLVKLKNGDLRATLNELQFQTASEKDMFLLLENVTNGKNKRLPEDWNRATISVAPDRQYAMRAKKKQYREIVLSTEKKFEIRPNCNWNIGYKVMNSINPNGYLVRPVTVDYVPYLMRMNQTEMQRKAKSGRRYQHYFNKVDQATGCGIDMTGDLILALHNFNFNSTTYVPPEEPHKDSYTLTQL